MVSRKQPDRPVHQDTDLRLEVHETVLAQLLAQVARDSGGEALSKVFIGAQQHMINLRVVRGKSLKDNPEIKEIESHFNRLGALMHAAFIKYSKDQGGCLVLGQ